MGVFGRRSKADGVGDASDLDITRDAAEGDSDLGEPGPATADEDGAERQVDEPRTQGPWDEGDQYPDVPRVDLGALRIPQSDAYRIQVQADPSTGNVTLVSLVTDASAVQLQPFAAPRSAGTWQDIRGQIKSQINKGGGLVEEVDGPFGGELRAQVRTQGAQTAAEGSQGTQPARFCGVDGPRWFLRMVFLGQAARDRAAAVPLEDAVRSVVVVRGSQAMPVGNAIPMRVPVETDEVETGDVGTSPRRPVITLPERGPEITETR